MVSKSWLRKAVLALSLIGTILASIFPLDEAPVVPKASVPASANQPLVSVVAMSEAVAPDEETEKEGDPFAPRNWQPPPPPEPPKVVATQPVVPVILAPEGPPRLPFQFMGRLNDGDDQVIYLAHGDQALVARKGDVLEGTYKVLSLGTSQIEFEHMPTGQKQALSVQSN